MTQAKEVIPNLIYFNFSVFAFHNMGQLNIQWKQAIPGSLACNPDTRFAALDSLQTIVADFQGTTNQQEPSQIALFNPDANQFGAFLAFLKKAQASDSEYIRHMKEFLNDYLMSKYNESTEGMDIGKPIQALFETGTYQEYLDLISSMYFAGSPMATSKSPTCGRVKIPHPGDRIECTNLEEKDPYFFLFHPGGFVWFGRSVKPPP